jgi:hypothetical protein
MFRRLCLAWSLLVLGATTGWATTALQLSNQDLATQADLVVIGNCVDLRTVWVDRMLVTLATIQVSENLRGTGSSVTVVLPGGVDADRPVPVMMSYPGAPRIALDEEVFLFLEDETPTLGGYTVVGFSQGKFTIVTDSHGRKGVDRDLTNLDLQSGKGVTRGTRTSTSLQEFKEEIQRYLGNR